jgi:hypothetical protein
MDNNKKLTGKLLSKLVKKIKSLNSTPLKKLPKEMMLNIFEYFRQYALSDEYLSSEINNLDVCIQFYLNDEDYYCWLSARDNIIEFGNGKGADITVTFIGSKETLLGILSGQEDMIWCYEDGDISIELSNPDANSRKDKYNSIDGYRSEQGLLLMSIRGIIYDFTFS